MERRPTQTPAKVQGMFQRVAWCKAPQFEPQVKTATQKKGLRYEARVIKRLEELYLESCQVLAGPWISYDGLVCQPDAVIVPENNSMAVVLVEVKLTYKRKATDKARSLYKPLLKVLFPDRKIICAQIFNRVRYGFNEPTVKIEQLLEKHDSKFLLCHWF